MAINTANTSSGLNWTASGSATVGLSGQGLRFVWFWLKLDSFTNGRNISQLITLDNTNGAGAQDLRLSITRLTTSTEIRTSSTALVVGEWTFVCAATLADTANATGRMWVGRSDTPPVLQTQTTVVAGAGNPLLQALATLNNTTTGTNSGNLTTDGWGGVGSGDSTSTTSWLGLSSFTAPSADDEVLMLNRVVIPAWQGQVLPIPSVSATVAVWGNVLTYQQGDGNYTPTLQTRRLSGNFANTQVTPLGTILSAERCPRVVSNVDFPYLRR